MKISASILTLVLLFLAARTRADTYVGGFISGDSTWTQANSPYVVQDSIAIIGGATLTIDPGVQVRIEPDLAFVVDTGTLVARGTESAPIRFTPNQGSANRWGYIQFSDNAVDATLDAGGNYISGSILEHTIVENAGSLSTDYAVRAVNSRPFIYKSTVRDNSYGGIYINGSGASSTCVKESEITGNTGRSGIYVENSPGVLVTGSTIAGNNSGAYGGAGLRLASSSNCTLSGNTISNNNASSPGGGVYLDQCESSTITGNTISGNAGGNGGGLWLGASHGSILSANTISGNSSSGSGGGAYLGSSPGCTVTDNTISFNTAGSMGGGLRLHDISSLLFQENNVTNNTAAAHGGGIYARSSENLTFSGDRITDNHSNQADGVGGIYMTNSCDGCDLTGPDDAQSPELCVQIYGNDNYQLYNDNAFGGSFGYGDPGNVDARYVWWGMTDEGEIEGGIYDFFDDAANGVVFYSPYAVPEPATLAFLGASASLLLKRRSKMPKVRKSR